MSNRMQEMEMHEARSPSQPVAAVETRSRQESIIELAMNKYAGAKKLVTRGAMSHDASKDAIASSLEQGRDALADVGLESQHSDAALSIAIFRPLAALAKHYEELRVALWLRDADNALKVLLFVGPTSGNGVSTTASNYAAMVAQDAGVKVLLIDANLREAESDRRIRQEGDRHDQGLADLLTKSTGSAYRVPGPTNLYVLPSGTHCGMPLGLFQSTAFDRFLQTVRERFQYIIVDAPPIQGHPETLVLSRKADGTVLVIESEKTRKQTALWAKQQIEDAGGRLLGVVLNKRKQHVPDWLYRRVFV